ncbi:MAG: hypothetical protein SF187_27800 [Deltaproteobacteria bacterium]|nr:hypothetical protein [Deltaproteobacteria bacterium]
MRVHSPQFNVTVLVLLLSMGCAASISDDDGAGGTGGEDGKGGEAGAGEGGEAVVDSAGRGGQASGGASLTGGVAGTAGPQGGNTTTPIGGNGMSASGGNAAPATFDVPKHLLATAEGTKSEAAPSGVPATWSWVVGATAPKLSPPTAAHTHANYWGAVFRGPSNNTPSNTHVEIRECQAWVLYRGSTQWVRIDNDVGLGGSTFSPTYAGGGPAPLLTKQTSGADVVPAPGYIWHYWPSNSYQAIRSTEVREVISNCQTRLALRDPKGTDDRDTADYINHVGIDWRDPADPACVNSNRVCPSFGVSMFFKVGKEWRNNTFHSVTKADIDAGVPLPPASMFAVSSAVTPPAAGGPLRIVIIGDSITEQVASWIHPFQQNLMSAGCAFELIGYERSPYNGAYVAPAGLSARRIAAGGFSSRGIRNWIDANGRQFGGVPDLLIEYLGVNNVYGGFLDGKYNPDVKADAAGAYVTDTKEILGWARLQNPRVAAFLMKIQDNLLAQIGVAIEQVVKEASTAASVVQSVVPASGVSRGTDVHPDAAGAARLATPISEAVIAFMKNAGRCR